MGESCDPIKYNSEGQCFANVSRSSRFPFKKAYKNLADEGGILVNLGLALMQKGLVHPNVLTDWRCAVTKDVFDELLPKILAFCCSGAANIKKALAWPTL